ncbi:MAG TPA: NUDIX domain-containing protein [Bryobacteraceae bacterium]|nr:NUDIX domain-containing protein [Bryobacteraceae bacterium]
MEPAAVARLLEGFHPDGDGEAAKSRELVLALLESSEAPFSRRQFNPGHVTCSGLVFSPARDRILLVLHRRLQRWLPGGHVEPDDEAIADAGRREVIEETGAMLSADPAPRLVGVDVHAIPRRRDEAFHLHHDLTFRFQATSEAFAACEEVREVTWCAAAEFDRYQLPGNLRRTYARALSDGPR